MRYNGGMAWFARMSRITVIVAGSLGFGLAVSADSRGSSNTCRFATREKLGVTFYSVCSATGAQSAFWISAPLGCGQGEHGTVQCPEATALVGASVPPVGAEPIAPKPVAMVDAFTAHRLCGMRFAGRLPSRAQRTRAREALGLATLLVTQGSPAKREMWLSELPEWVTEGNCDNPSTPGTTCSIASFPPAPLSLPLAWSSLRACKAFPLGNVSAKSELSELGKDCTNNSDDRTESECLLRSPGAAQTSYAIRCAPATSAVHAPSPRESVAAVRCVVAAWAL
jgi:hypothetical protein